MPRTETVQKFTSTDSPAMEVHEPEKRVAVDGEMPVVQYPRIETRIYAVGYDYDPLDSDGAEDLLGWESEEQFTARMSEGMSEEERKRHAFHYGTDFDFLDVKGDKIKCWNNIGNREFDREHCLSLAQDHLTRDWADSRNGGTIKVQLDPDTFPEGGEVDLSEMSLNGETIIVTRTSRTASAQHRLISLIFANQMWKAEPEKWPAWTDAPTMECIIVYGISDSPRVIQTLDNVKPRSEADTIAATQFPDATPFERREWSQALAAATDFVWKRTQVEGLHQTHSASMAFRKRHPSLVRAVQHVCGENKTGRPLSRLKFSQGTCSGLMYLFASSQTDTPTYRDVDPRLRAETLVEMDKSVTAQGRERPVWDASELFWTLVTASVSDTGDRTMVPIKDELGRLANGTEGGATAAEKVGILCVAWNLWSTGNTLTQEDLRLDYRQRDDGTKIVDPHPCVGGIDLGVKPAKVKDSDPSAEELERVRVEKDAEIARQNAEAAKKASAGKREKKKSIPEQYLAIAEKHKDKVVLWKTAAGSYSTYGPTAERMVQVLGVPKPKPSADGIPLVILWEADIEKHMVKLGAAGLKVAIAQEQTIGGQKQVVVTWDSEKDKSIKVK